MPADMEAGLLRYMKTHNIADTPQGRVDTHNMLMRTRKVKK